jgi:hypothetical protein
MKKFLNLTSQNYRVGLDVLPNEFLLLYFHDIDVRFIVANRNIVTSACFEYREALKIISLQEFKQCMQWDHITSAMHSTVSP